MPSMMEGVTSPSSLGTSGHSKAAPSIEIQMLQYKTPLSSMFSFLKTIYLFPRNDIPTMIIPVTCLGTCAALSVCSKQPNAILLLWETLSRVPQTFFWVWINVLLFSISNQRSEEAMIEDSINKPWRPLPAGRITPAQARRLLLFGIPLVLALCHSFLGAVEETVVCLLLTWMYNDLGGADEHFLVRNGVNSAAYFVYGCGAMRVASGVSLQSALNSDAVEWLGIVSAIILSTMHVQDLKDQEGDRARDRSTAPLAVGDAPARWTIAFGVLTWSILAPVYWCTHIAGSWSSTMHSHRIRIVAATIPCILAGLVSLRVLLWRDPRSDTATYKYWSVWLMSIFALPLLTFMSP